MSKEKLVKPNQALEAVNVSIKPLNQLPVTIDFFNGVQYEGDDGVMYNGYTPVVIGTISTNPEDENYIDEEKWKALAMDAYEDVDSYANKAMTVLGMFNTVPNFRAIPIWTKDQMMRAICAKIEQNIYTKPSNAELKVSVGQDSGGRTTDMPGRENFNPSDALNQKVKAYIDGSNIFELVADSFYAVILDRNEYVTKEQLAAILVSGEVPIEKIFTLNLEEYTAPEPGDAINRYIHDLDINDLQNQLNALVVGDIELKTDHVSLRNKDIESWTGLAVHQRDVNTENKIVMNQHKNRLDELDRRTGVPLQASKTLSQNINSPLYTTIVGYDLVGNGTVDSLNGFNPETGEYLIQGSSAGDNVSIEATFKVTGKPLPGQIVGYATIQKNGETVLHPVTGNVIEIPLFIQTTAGGVFTVVIKDFNVRVEVENEFNVSDSLSLAIKQTAASIASGFPLTISDVQFDLINNRILAEKDAKIGGTIGSTLDLQLFNNLEESPSTSSNNQYELNVENKTKLDEIDVKLNGLESEILDKVSRDYEETEILGGEYISFRAFEHNRFSGYMDVVRSDRTTDGIDTGKTTIIRAKARSTTQPSFGSSIGVLVADYGSGTYEPFSAKEPEDIVVKEYADDHYAPISLLEENKKLRSEIEFLKDEIIQIRQKMGEGR